MAEAQKQLVYIDIHSEFMGLFMGYPNALFLLIHICKCYQWAADKNNGKMPESIFIKYLETGLTAQSYRTSKEFLIRNQQISVTSSTTGSQIKLLPTSVIKFTVTSSNDVKNKKKSEVIPGNRAKKIIKASSDQGFEVLKTDKVTEQNAPDNRAENSPQVNNDNEKQEQENVEVTETRKNDKIENVEKTGVHNRAKTAEGNRAEKSLQVNNDKGIKTLKSNEVTEQNQSRVTDTKQIKNLLLFTTISKYNYNIILKTITNTNTSIDYVEIAKAIKESLEAKNLDNETAILLLEGLKKICEEKEPESFQKLNDKADKIIEKIKKDSKAFSLYTECIEVYDQFCKRETSSGCKMSGAEGGIEGAAMKDIIKYLTAQAKDKSENNVLEFWKWTLSKEQWDLLKDPFLKNGVKLRQINSNLLNILKVYADVRKQSKNAVSNNISSKPVASIEEHKGQSL